MIFYVELSMEFRIPVLIKFLIWFFWAIYGNSIYGFYISSYRSNSLFSIDLLSYRYWSNWYVLILSFWSNYEFFWHARTYWATVLIEFRKFFILSYWSNSCHGFYIELYLPPQYLHHDWPLVHLICAKKTTLPRVRLRTHHHHQELGSEDINNNKLSKKVFSPEEWTLVCACVCSFCDNTNTTMFLQPADNTTVSVETFITRKW